MPTLDLAPRLVACAAAVGHDFGQPALLELALTHASCRAEGFGCNERLEFLGDSVLGLIMAEYLLREHPECAEGELTRIKSVVVSTVSLARAARRLGLDTHVRLGRGFGQRRPLPDRVLANVYEAVIGAVYLDAGPAAATEVVLRTLEREVRKVRHNRHEANYKSLLQQLTQRHLGRTPTYDLLSSSGPEHGRRFQLCAVVGTRRFAPAWGQTKKEAERQAARLALESLGDELDVDPMAGLGADG